MTTAPTRPASVTTILGPVEIGQVLAEKYRVERVLGAGGMGVVVAAHHLQLELEVAIKFLRGEALMDGEAVARFQREARAAVKLKSEHVARVLDVGTLASGSPFLVMELLDGLDLGTLIESGEKIATGDAVDYVLQASEAVAEAHSLGIVHRDLKPRNLFLTTRVDGRPLVKVLDFGISKLLEGAAEGANFTLTSTTDIVGSPSYMSPEQLRSARTVDERTDIWSLGVVLFELLTAKLPFDGEKRDVDRPDDRAGRAAEPPRSPPRRASGARSGGDAVPGEGQDEALPERERDGARARAVRRAPADRRGRAHRQGAAVGAAHVDPGRALVGAGGGVGRHQRLVGRDRARADAGVDAAAADTPPPHLRGRRPRAARRQRRARLAPRAPRAAAAACRRNLGHGQRARRDAGAADRAQGRRAPRRRRARHRRSATVTPTSRKLYARPPGPPPVVVAVQATGAIAPPPAPSASTPRPQVDDHQGFATHRHAVRAKIAP